MTIGTLEPSLFLAVMARITVLLVGIGLILERPKAREPREERLPIPKPFPFFGE